MAADGGKGKQKENKKEDKESEDKDMCEYSDYSLISTE